MSGWAGAGGGGYTCPEISIALGFPGALGLVGFIRAEEMFFHGWVVMESRGYVAGCRGVIIARVI